MLARARLLPDCAESTTLAGDVLDAVDDGVPVGVAVIEAVDETELVGVLLDVAVRDPELVELGDAVLDAVFDCVETGVIVALGDAPSVMLGEGEDVPDTDTDAEGVSDGVQVMGVMESSITYPGHASHEPAALEVLPN